MYVRINNRKIHYKRSGHGPPVLLVHGWGGTLYSLHALSHLLDNEYSVFILDLPGFGKSDNPPPHWGVEGYAECIRAFIKELKIDKPFYFGHSFGGEIGIFLASTYPRLFSKLVLCSSSFKREKKISKLARLLKLIPENKRVFLKSIEPHIKKIYYRLLHRDSDLMKYPHLEHNFRKIITQDLTSESRHISTPTLILWGEDDTMTPVLWAYELAKYIPNSTLKVFPDVRHNLPIIHPDLVWTEVKPFFST
jgi:pimeloyl-ACP methyl ester carboxylesterase